MAVGAVAALAPAAFRACSGRRASLAGALPPRDLAARSKRADDMRIERLAILRSTSLWWHVRFTI